MMRHECFRPYAHGAQLPSLSACVNGTSHYDADHRMRGVGVEPSVEGSTAYFRRLIAAGGAPAQCWELPADCSAQPALGVLEALLHPRSRQAILVSERSRARPLSVHGVGQRSGFCDRSTMIHRLRQQFGENGSQLHGQHVDSVASRAPSTKLVVEAVAAAPRSQA